MANFTRAANKGSLSALGIHASSDFGLWLLTNVMSNLVRNLRLAPILTPGGAHPRLARKVAHAAPVPSKGPSAENGKTPKPQRFGALAAGVLVLTSLTGCGLPTNDEHEERLTVQLCVDTSPEPVCTDHGAATDENRAAIEHVLDDVPEVVSYRYISLGKRPTKSSTKALRAKKNPWRESNPVTFRTGISCGSRRAPTGRAWPRSWPGCAGWRRSPSSKTPRDHRFGPPEPMRTVEPHDIRHDPGGVKRGETS